MSLSEGRKSSGSLRTVASIALISTTILAAACTVHPLYSDGPDSADVATHTTTQLTSINIKPVNTRYSQEVRNHLIFLFNYGAGQPDAAPYLMALSVDLLTEDALFAQVACQDDEPTSGTVTLTATYVVTKISTGKIVASGKRNITSSYDRLRQEFANMRAQRDAENRAARQLAEVLRLAIVQEMRKR